MGKLLEVLRRLLLASMYIGVPIFIAIMIKSGYDEWTAWMAGECMISLRAASSSQHSAVKLCCTLIVMSIMTVASVMVIIFYAFSGRARDISDEEW